MIQTLRNGFPIMLIGFMSGMTVLLSGGTLNFWLASNGTDKTTIGLFALVSLPYAINFLWAPALDRCNIPILSKYFSRRLSWVILLQIMLSMSVWGISKISLTSDIASFAIFAVLISFFSSTQDVALGAIRTSLVPSNAQGAIAGMYLLGYRLGMLLSSSGAIYISIFYSWSEIYSFLARIILFFPLILYLICYRKLEHSFLSGLSENESIPTKIDISIKYWQKALRQVGPISLILMISLFLVIYRLPDNFLGIMINPFLFDIGFDEFAIATIGKFLGILTAIIGGLIAGQMMKNRAIIDCLFYFGLIHSIAHLLFIIQNHLGNNMLSLFIVIGFESLTGGMVMASYIAFITSMCGGPYSATQYSFFSSMMGLSRSIFPSISGILVQEYGWDNFFFIITLMTIPALLLSLKVKKLLES